MTFVIAALAVYRLTVLITTDSITEPVREAIAEEWPGEWPDTLVNCPWCVGFWISVVVTVLLIPVVSLPLVGWVLLPLALSGVTGLLESWRLGD